MSKIFEAGNTLPEKNNSKKQEQIEEVETPSEGKIFFDEYLSLERGKKAAFRFNILQWCAVQQTTFHDWIRNRRVPIWHQKIIAHHMKRDGNELFPNP